jgi:formate dehydrogenase subunit gamma
MEESRVLHSGRLLRYNFKERLVHWFAGLSYIYLMLTGLAFWSPWCFWIAVILGGGTVSRMLHPWVGLVYAASVIYMLGIWNADMKITDTDRKWTKTIGAYVRNEEEEQLPEHAERAWQQWAPVDRFNLGQKYLFWTMFWGGIVLLLTGVVLWFPDRFPQPVRLVSIFVHPLAFLATLAGFIIHVYMGTAVVRGGFTSIIRGEVTENWARHHHRLWVERILGDAAARK